MLGNVVVYIDEWFINLSTLIQHCSHFFLVSSISSISSNFFQFLPVSFGINPFFRPEGKKLVSSRKNPTLFHI